MSQSVHLDISTVLGATARGHLDDISINPDPQLLYTAAPEAQKWHQGHPEHYNGIITSADGAYRVCLHEPSGTRLLVMAKNAHWLRGEEDEHGILRPIGGTLKGIYGVAAYNGLRTHMGGVPQPSAVVRGLTWERDLRAFSGKIRQVSQMHLTMHGADISSMVGNDGSYTMMANARQGYALIRSTPGAPTTLVHYTEDKAHGGVMHLHAENNLLKRALSTGRSLGNFSTTEELGKSLVDHWKQKASDEWYGIDGISLAESLRSPLVTAKRSIRGGMEWVSEEGYKALAASALLAGGFTMLGPAGLGAVLPAVIAAIEHRTLDEVLVKNYDRYIKDRLKKLFPEDDVPFHPGHNIIDHFLKRDVANLKRICPELSDHFAKEIRFLNAHDSRIGVDGAYMYEGFGKDWLYEWMMTVPSKGLNSFSAMPDSNSMIIQCMNGYIGLYYFDPKTEILTAYAKYRPELNVTGDILKIPRVVRDEIDDPKRILKMTYQRNRQMRIEEAKDGALGIDHEYVSLSTVMADMERRFQNTITEREDIPASLDYIRRTFDETPEPGLIVLPFPHLRAAAPGLF